MQEKRRDMNNEEYFVRLRGVMQPNIVLANMGMAPKILLGRAEYQNRAFLAV